jgi:chromosomal replication initiator protein
MSIQVNHTGFAGAMLDAQFWKQIKESLRLRNKDNNWVRNWIEPIEYVDTLGTVALPRIVLGVPSSIHHYFILENLMNQIYSEITATYKSEFEIDVIISGAKSPTNETQSQSSKPTQTDAYAQPELTPQGQQRYSSPPQVTIPPLSVSKAGDVLNHDYVFGTFVVGRNTEFAHAASYNVAQNPGAEGYNPLLICGPVGMGKTHLLHAVGNQIRQSFPHLRITYIGAERFLNECVSHLRHQQMDKFRQKYRESSDILLVDDVQYIGRGEAVQEEFFHMINAFIEKRKQVVLASDRMPKDILGLEDRSRSRLEWGLIADISMPDIETRVAILRYKAEKMAIRLNEEVVNYIARISKRSVRELEGNLKKVKMFSELQGLSIDIELARRVLANHETTSTISLEDIQKLVADHFKVRVTDLKSTTRAKQIVVPRQISMYLIKKHLDKSLVDIGRAFGGKDHTTVMNALERVALLQGRDLTIKSDIDELTTRIHNITGL